MVLVACLLFDVVLVVAPLELGAPPAPLELAAPPAPLELAALLSDCCFLHC